MNIDITKLKSGIEDSIDIDLDDKFIGACNDLSIADVPPPSGKASSK